MNEILLTSIYTAIDQIDFPRKSYYFKARLICQSIFNKLNNNNDFTEHIGIADAYFKTIIRRNLDRGTILAKLKLYKIIECKKTLDEVTGKYKETYSTGFIDEITGIKHDPYPKSYRFCADIIYNRPITFTAFKGINEISDRVKFINIKKSLDLITVDLSVYNYIPKLIEAELTKIVCNDSIIDQWIMLPKYSKDGKTKHISYWKAIAVNKNADLIFFHDKYYIEKMDTFIKRKRIELDIIYTGSIARITNGHFYANRNDTNNRLDYNLTGLKKELFQFIEFDGEKTKEIDIANAQFAIFSNMPQFQHDLKYVELAQNGTLYKYVASELGMTESEAKKYMMILAFGKVKKSHDTLRKLFPITMATIDNFKNEFGYEEFSVELQKAESNLMIDGVFSLLFKNNIPTLPVHDSMRVKASDEVRVKEMMLKFFDSKEVKCTLKNKK